jgi:hypothetical protein
LPLGQNVHHRYGINQWKYEMKIRQLLFLLVLLVLSGCDAPTYRYRIDLVTPGGEVHKTWYWKRTSPPIVNQRWGGQTYIVPAAVGIKAPTGWYLDITNTGEVE